MGGESWTDDELNLLKGYWEDKVPAPIIGEKLGRTRHSIWNKAAHSGLQRRQFKRPWVTNLVETLTRLWKEGWSATEIRQKEPELAVYSRNALLGKLHRLGLLRTRAPESLRRKHNPRIPRRQRQITAHTVFVLPVELQEFKPPMHIELENLQPHHCRYPFGDERITYCGQPKRVGSYCAHHFRICYREG